MGMCLEGQGKFACEVRRESVILSYGDDDDPAPQTIEFYHSEVNDLKSALDEAVEYILSKKARP